MTQDFLFSFQTPCDTQVNSLSLNLNVSLFFLQFLYFSLGLSWTLSLCSLGLSPCAVNLGFSSLSSPSLNSQAVKRSSEILAFVLILSYCSHSLSLSNSGCLSLSIRIGFKFEDLSLEIYYKIWSQHINR